MLELDDRLLRCRDAVADAATDLRARALAVDAEPDDMAAHLGSPVLAMIRDGSIPARFRPSGPAAVPLGSFTDSCLDRVVSTVEFARGDAGVLLACPGPALAGIVVDALGSPAQQELFYRRVVDGGVWTFFAMTEPEHGSDAAAMETRLEKAADGGHRLHGVKRYIGNAARAGIGVVFARTGRGALSIRAALVELPAPGCTARRLDMIGLRGAYLSELRFDGAEVPAGMLLGQHLPVARRGMWGAIKTFNQMRVQIGAMALGTALAMHDCVRGLRPAAADVDLMASRLAAARLLIYEAAAAVDADPERGYLSSVGKLHCTRLGIDVARWAVGALGPAALLEHPLLEKWSRDIRAFEFMDGTANMQRLTVAQAYLKAGGHA
jgi:alkylation response protein AidB-like acyl-CoA dehydrogenase